MNHSTATCGHAIIAVGAPNSPARLRDEGRPCGRCRVSYYLCRDVVRGAACSYPAGRTLLREAGRESRDDAQRRADVFNAHCHVAGVHYLVVPWPEELPFEADHYENAC